MKPFNLEEYLKNPSRKVITRYGKPVKIHCTNYITHKQVIAEIEGRDCSESFSKEGRYYNDTDNSSNDLFFVPEEHEKWINIYRNTTGVGSGSVLYDSREEAEEVGKSYEHYVATAKVEWEE